jgi:hypothetical protein
LDGLESLGIEEVCFGLEWLIMREISFGLSGIDLNGGSSFLA